MLIPQPVSAYRGKTSQNQISRKAFNSNNMKTFVVTGTYHGAIIYAKTEGEARRLFHKQYNGESIVYLTVKPDGFFYAY